MLGGAILQEHGRFISGIQQGSGLETFKSRDLVFGLWIWRFCTTFHTYLGALFSVAAIFLPSGLAFLGQGCILAKLASKHSVVLATASPSHLIGGREFE